MVETLCLAFVIGFFSALLLIVLVIIIFPHLPIFPGYYIPETSHFLVKLVFCYTYSTYILIYLFINVALLLLAALLASFYYIPFVIFELKLGRLKKAYKSCKTLRDPLINLMMAFRTCQIVQLLLNNVLGIFLVPTHFLVCQFVVMGTYTVVKHIHELTVTTSVFAIFVLVNVGLFWGTFLMMGGYAHLYGVKVLESWKYYKNYKSRNEKKLMSKFRKSCKPIMINYYSYFIMRRLSVLKFVRSLSRGILRALLAL